VTNIILLSLKPIDICRRTSTAVDAELGDQRTTGKICQERNVDNTISMRMEAAT